MKYDRIRASPRGIETRISDIKSLKISLKDRIRASPRGIETYSLLTFLNPVLLYYDRIRASPRGIETYNLSQQRGSHFHNR